MSANTRIVVREGEELSEAIKRFQKRFNNARRRPAYKRRYGYYEKPGELRRKKRRLKERNRRIIGSGGGPVNPNLYPRLLYSREGEK